MPTAKERQIKNRKRVSNNILQYLEKHNMSQTELGRKIGVKREYINRIINNDIITRWPLAMKIARVFGARMEDVFELKPN